jgi:hypothetical protein
MGFGEHPLATVKAHALAAAPPLDVRGLRELEAAAVRSAESVRAIVLAMRAEEKEAMAGTYAEHAAKKELTELYVRTLRTLLASPW